MPDVVDAVFEIVLLFPEFCFASNSRIVTRKYDHKMENIVRVRPFRRHSFHIRSGKKHPFEIKPRAE